jgi:hypothetical protein
MLGMVVMLLPLIGAFIPMRAQYYNRHNINVMVGAGLPRGELRTLFSDSALVGVDYGYRFHRNLQVDAGFDSVFGAAGVRDWLPSQFGNLRIRDFQTFVPFGGRVILPLNEERIHIYGGLGGVYMRYAERINQPVDYFRIPCDVCAARDGFGYYGLFGVNASFDQRRMFRFGAGTRVYRGHTSGDRLGAVPPRETTDRWINIFGTVSITF